MTKVAQKRKKVPITGTIDNKIIIISPNGNLVCEESDATIRPIGLLDDEDILKVLSKRQTISTGILAKNTIFYERFSSKDNQNCHMVVLEFEPQVYSINHKFEYYIGDKAFNYSLGLPYVQFYACIKEYNGKPTLHNYATITCTNKSIRTEKDPVFALPLHNLQEDNGNICWGLTPLVKADNETAGSYVRKLVTHYFTLKFNCHLRPKWPLQMLKDAGIKTYDVYSNAQKVFDFWHESTIKDPKFILNYDFVPYATGDTFSKVVERTKNGV